MNEKMTYKKLAWLSLLALFMLGFAVGFAVDRLAFSEKEKHAKSSGHDDRCLVEKFTKDLVLTKYQRDSLVVYLGKLRKQHSELRKTVNPQFQRLREEFRSSFSHILTEEQKAKFAEMNRKYDQKQK